MQGKLDDKYKINNHSKIYIFLIEIAYPFKSCKVFHCSDPSHSIDIEPTQRSLIS